MSGKENVNIKITIKEIMKVTSRNILYLEMKSKSLNYYNFNWKKK